MGKTLIGALARSAGTLLNRTPAPYTSQNSRTTGYAGAFGRPAGTEAQMRAMSTNGTLFAIVDRITTSYSQVEWKLYRKARSGRKEDRVEVTSHAVLDLWNSPNSFMTGEAFREATQQHEELTGEQWWVIACNPLATIPLEIWPVRPDRMEPVPHPQDFLTGYVYTGPGGEKVPLGVDEVIFLRRPNPLDPYRGMGPVQTILTDLDALRYSKEWNRNFFVSSAEPGGVLQVDRRLDDDEFEELRTRWAEQHRGVGAAHRVAILENGLQWVDRKYTNKDMQFVELGTAGRETIREAFGFPKPMLGSVDDVNRANADAAELVLSRWLLVPRLKRTRAAVNTRLLPMFGATARDLEFDFVSPVADDVEADAAQLTARANAASTLVAAGFDPEDVLSAVNLPAMRALAPPAPAKPALPPAPAARSTPYLLSDRTPTPPAPGPVALATDTGIPALEAVRQDFDSALDQLMGDWDGIEDTWYASLEAQIKAAINTDDTAALATLTVPADQATQVLRSALADMAEQAAARVAQEAAAQGVIVTTPDLDPALRNAWRVPFTAVYGSDLADVAQVTAMLLASGTAAAAGREALRLLRPGADGTSVAASVVATLRGLKNWFRRDQLAGVLHRAQNTGRHAAFAAAPGAEYTATEQLDGETCKPCKAIDGTVFEGLAAADAVYGAGGYTDCDGGSRCRGMVLATWTAAPEEGQA